MADDSKKNNDNETAGTEEDESSATFAEAQASQDEVRSDDEIEAEILDETASDDGNGLNADESSIGQGDAPEVLAASAALDSEELGDGDEDAPEARDESTEGTAKSSGGIMPYLLIGGLAAVVVVGIIAGGARQDGGDA
ncbi:MAG: hypothetical protein AAGG79_03065, partial [Pseudomonadota bacterium]